MMATTMTPGQISQWRSPEILRSPGRVPLILLPLASEPLPSEPPTPLPPIPPSTVLPRPPSPAPAPPRRSGPLRPPPVRPWPPTPVPPRPPAPVLTRPPEVLHWLPHVPLGGVTFEREKKLDTCHVVPKLLYYRTPIPKFHFEMLLCNLSR